jgi:DNA-binding protein H-NS
MMDLSKLSASDLRDLQEQLAQELSKREHEEVNKAREQILAIAHSVGIPLKDLITSSPRARQRKGVTRYRHPANASLQWSGRGRQPRWIKEWLASGHPLDGLRA